MKLNKLVLLSTWILGSLALGATSSNAASIDNADLMPDISQQKVMVGYYQNWASYGDGYQGGTAKTMELTDINENYNVIDVAFMTGDTLPTFKPFNMTDEAFKLQVAELNEEGRAVLISLGGADAKINLHKGQEKELANRIINLVTTYGFDGLDIDLEQDAILAADNQTVIPDALKIVKNHYKKEGKNFIITMAPEFPYLRGGGAYESYISQLEGYYDFIAPQLYNQEGDGISTEDGWIAQNNNDKKYEFLSGIAESLNSGNNGFVKIPSEKLVLGLPSNVDGAANGFVHNPQDVYRTFETMADKGHELKGLMTWSVNWDEGVNRDGIQYDSQFVKDYSQLIHDATIISPESEFSLAVTKLEVKSSQLHFEMDGDYFRGSNRIIIDINNSYAGELFEGKNYYGASVTNSNADIVGISLNTSLKVGDEVQIRLSSGKPGQSSDIVESKVFIITEYMLKNNFSSAISNVELVNNHMDLDMNGEFFRGSHRVIIDVNNSYAGELFEGKNYHGAPVANSNADVVGISLNKKLKVGDEVRIRLSSGKPGQKSDILEFKVFTVTKNGLVEDTTGLPEVSEWSKEASYNTGDIVRYKEGIFQANWWTQGNAPDQFDDWTLIDGIQEWSVSKAYKTNEKVSYNGLIYQAAYWVRGETPSTSSAWVLVK